MDIKNFLHENIQPGIKTVTFLSRLDEAASMQVSETLIAELYKSAIQKYEYIDFGDIPESKGDITRLKQFKVMEDTLKLLNDISTQTNINIDELKIVNDTFNNLKLYKKDFAMGFVEDIQIIQVVYNTMALSLICAINLIITIYVEYIREPGSDMKDIISKNKKTKNREYAFIKNLEKFNKMANSNDLNKFFSHYLMKNNFVGAAGAVMTLGAIAILIPLVRELLFYVYDIRMDVSEYFKLQSALLKSNAETLKHNSDMKTISNKKDVIKKQDAMSKNLMKISDMFRVKFEVSENKTKRELDKKIEVSQLKPMDNPNSLGLL